MDDDDWDLHAVVRGCAAVLAATRSAPQSNTLPTLPSDSDQTQNSSFHFPTLQDYMIVQSQLPPPPPTTAVMPIPAAHLFQSHQEMVRIRPPLQMNMQRFPAAAAAIPQRPRRRKNQQTKLVREMTQEELSADSWAWRKYGQKPIKGSPYPRNYYRCSTSKGCSARKQVERSPNEAGIFIVSYTGEHTHARPTHRSSLSGSTRTKFVAKNNNALLLHRGTESSSSPSASSLSPATPPSDAQNDDAEMAHDEDAATGDDDDDLFRGFQDSDYSSGGGGEFFPGGLLSSPPWSPAGSAGNAATFNGGGGC
ncbi:hypothetical protein ACS0TY_004657 [Phlomoides rotata]